LRYPHAAEIDDSGIGNTFYVLDTDNVDHYPLMQPVAVSTALPPSSTPLSDLQLTMISIVAVVILAILLLVYSIRRKGAKSLSIA
jgi:hypothetical protein